MTSTIRRSFPVPAEPDSGPSWPRRREETARQVLTDQIEMEGTQIADQLRSFVQQRFNVSEADADFSDDVHLFDYGYVDSFGAVELNSYVEKTFAIKVAPSDLIAFPLNTISEIATFIAKRQAGEI